MKEINNNTIAEELREAGVRASSARVMILKYLLKERNHPTADRIYTDITEHLPGLSRTSVYNTLATLQDAKLVRPLTIDGTEMRYDATVEDHGHFKCESCGKVYDISADMNGIKVSGIRGFRISQRDLILRGTCPHCARKQLDMQ
ncbi:MAG: transcriptional repressor [Clostridiales Family XIII bacterium]|jgi:Fur family peroxide stress response transcriptional regulator|nr:transcriptional repressor [Clostridiales Family XIII bacterium]